MKRREESEEEASLKPTAKTAKYPSFAERYFTRFYKLEVTPEKDRVPPVAHVQVLVHSNGICVVTLAPSHPILADRLKAVQIDFQVSKKVNRLENAVKGKGKKGGQFFHDDKQTLATVTCEDGSRHVLTNGVRGALVEANARLVSRPELLTSDPEGEGFLAIVLPRMSDRKPGKQGLLTEKEYKDRVTRCSSGERDENEDT